MCIEHLSLFSKSFLSLFYEAFKLNTEIYCCVFGSVTNCWSYLWFVFTNSFSENNLEMLLSNATLTLWGNEVCAMTICLLEASGLKSSHRWYLYQVQVKDRLPVLMRSDGQWSSGASNLYSSIAFPVNIHAAVGIIQESIGEGRQAKSGFLFFFLRGAVLRKGMVCRKRTQRNVDKS